MSGTRPARLFSHGSMASSARPSRTASIAVSNDFARQRGHVRIGDAAGEVGIGAGHALEGDRCRSCARRRRERRGARVPGRPAYRRRTAPCSTRAQAIRMPASSARNCSRLLAPFQRRFRQRDEARQRGAAVGIDADMVPARPVAPGDRLRARNTAPARPRWPRSNAQAAFTNGRQCSPPPPIAIGATSVPISKPGSASGVSTGRRYAGGMRRQIALQVHHHVVPPSRIEFGQRGVHAIGAATAAPDRSAPRGRRRRAPRRRSRRRRRPPRPGRYPPRAPRSQHMHDHRPAVDVGERLAGQPGGGHAGGDDDDRVQRRCVGHRSFPYGARTLWRRTAARNAAPAGLRVRLVWFDGEVAPHGQHGGQQGHCRGPGRRHRLLSHRPDRRHLVRETLPEKPALEHRGGARGRDRRRRGEAGRACRRSRRCWPRPTRQGRRGSSPTRSAPPATPSTRAARPASAPTCTASSARRTTHEEGFNYSAALKEKQGQPWTYDELNEWLHKPRPTCPAPAWRSPASPTTSSGPT